MKGSKKRIFQLTEMRKFWYRSFTNRLVDRCSKTNFPLAVKWFLVLTFGSDPRFVEAGISWSQVCRECCLIETQQDNAFIIRDEMMSNGSCNLEGKVVLVTGGSRGIGLEISRALLRENARVSICGRKQEGLEAAKAELSAEDRLLAVRAHVAQEEDVQNLFDITVNHFGKLDVLINNVGMNLLTGAFIDTELAVWHKIIDSNLTGAFLCSRRAAKIMRERGKGKIVNISSVAGRRAAPGMGIYGIAKAGIEMMTRVLALELSQYNIQVNAVAPGMVRTDFSKPFWSNEEILSQAVKAIPLGRIAEPVDVVNLVLFLSSDSSDYITGQTIMVDGGSTAI